MSEVSWEQAGVAVGAVGTLAGGIWTWVLRQRAALAKSRAGAAAERAEEAASRASSAISDAQTTTFQLLRDRQVQLEGELQELREQLEEERRARRAIEDRYVELLRWLKTNNVDYTPSP